jgi:hypothetical protein
MGQHFGYRCFARGSLFGQEVEVQFTVLIEVKPYVFATVIFKFREIVFVKKAKFNLSIGELREAFGIQNFTLWLRDKLGSHLSRVFGTGEEADGHKEEEQEVDWFHKAVVLVKKLCQIMALNEERT